MNGRIKVAPGYYGLAISSVHDCVESIGGDDDGRQTLRSMLDATDPGFAVFPADDGADCFYIVQRLPDGGIVAALGAHALRADTPGEAYELAANIAARANRPLMVAWIEMLDRAAMH
jgi:hypothetical protein